MYSEIVAPPLRAHDEQRGGVVIALDEIEFGADQIGRGFRPFDLYGADALAALDRDPRAIEARRHGEQQAYDERALAQRVVGLFVVSHLEELDAVQQSGQLHGHEPTLVSARVARHGDTPGGVRNVCDLVRSGRAHDVRDRRDEGGIARLDLDRLDRDDVRELPLERRLDEELGCRGRLGPTWREDLGEQTGAELRTHDPLTR